MTTMELVLLPPAGATVALLGRWLFRKLWSWRRERRWAVPVAEKYEALETRLTARVEDVERRLAVARERSLEIEDFLFGMKGRKLAATTKPKPATKGRQRSRPSK